jgi:hypothetical protein
MNEIRGKSPNFLSFQGIPAMKIDPASPFRLNSTPSEKISTACSAFP